ncbi:hypothetical protein LAH08_01567 [Micromonospora noduli]|uniref:Uncharacterized protein n=1 Tax=Micromonospora noduli TaxID=709876 RepID=A0A328NDD2_9ACTN|nr:hypothetical protein LAH08_01567 [Micromonospora noduli]RAO07941.1 hypothetical protein LUPAC07_05871 [Micromonospora noduli]
MADQGGEPAGEVGDGVEVRAAVAGIGEVGAAVVGELRPGRMIQAVIRRADGTRTVTGLGRVRLVMSQSFSTRRLP